jgi:hypothetical protein
MSSVESSLSELFAERGWSVAREFQDRLIGQFSLVAENDIAVAFVASAGQTDMRELAGRLSATIGAVMQASGGPKAWEAYLVIAVHALAEADEASITAIERDLAFCRKILIDADEVLGSPEPVRVLERDLALLFPLPAGPTVIGPSPTELLENNLIARGHDPEIVHGLVRGLDDSQFDPIDFLASKLAVEL